MIKKIGLLVIAAAVVGAAAGIVPLYASAAASRTADKANNAVGKISWSRGSQSLTADQKAALQAKMADRQAQMAAKKQAVDQAIANNDYSAWVKAVGATSALAKKITQDKFPQYVQLYNLEQQVAAQAKALGLGQGDWGFGNLRMAQ